MNDAAPTTPTTPAPNIALTGDEARILMAALSQSTVSIPSSVAITLYVRLNEIAQVQPPAQPTS